MKIEVEGSWSTRYCGPGVVEEFDCDRVNGEEGANSFI